MQKKDLTTLLPGAMYSIYKVARQHKKFVYQNRYSEEEGHNESKSKHMVLYSL